MSKNIKTEAICYWGKGKSHTGILTVRGELILYWGKREAPAFTLRGAEVSVETEAHITVQLESERGFIKLDGIGNYSWSTTGDYITLTDTMGRCLRVSPSGDVQEQTFTEKEAREVESAVGKIKTKERAEKSSKGLQVLIGIAALAYLWKIFV